MAGFDAADAARLAKLLASDAQVSGDENAGAEVICLGPNLEGRHAAAFLQRHPNGRFIVLAAGGEPELFQDFIDSDSIYFLSRRPPPLDDVAALLRSALAHERRDGLTTERGAIIVARAITRVVDRIATETDLERISGLLGNAASALTDADEARFAIVDAQHETLWFRTLEGGEPIRNSAASGLAGFVARTSEAISVQRLGDDPRYDAEADNDGRSPQERFLAVPVLAPGRARVDVVGVLIATREPSGAPFEDADRRRLEDLALQIAAIV
ncbi:MAG TPA: GAF domain-containing protein, partial [Thermoanaerobaculia bacterium]